MARKTGQLLPEVRHTSTSKGHSAARGRLLYRFIRALDEPIKIPWMLPAVSSPGVVHCDRGPLRGDVLGQYSVQWRRKRTVSHSIEDIWNARLSMMERVQEAKSSMENKSRNFDSSMLPSRKAMVHSRLEAIAATTESLSPGPPSMESESRRASGGISSGRDDAVAKCCLADARKGRIVCLLKGFNHLKSQVQ